MKKIILAGGTGFIGQYLAQQYNNLGYHVIIISRKAEHIQWHESDKMVEALNGAELVINLAGRSVDCRYNKKNKKLIMESRTETTRLIGEAILKCDVPPKLWLNSSSATYYRHAEDIPMTEETGEVGSGFSVEVIKAWEKTFFDFDLPQTRQAALRITIVLGEGSEVVKVFKRLTYLGAGGKQGKGNQMFSWIHIEDVFGIIRLIETEDQLQGVFNLAAPNPVTNEQLMRSLRLILNVPFGLPAPRWLLEIGAMLIRTETELVLKSRWVVPARILKAGYQFKYPQLIDALAQIIK